MVNPLDCASPLCPLLLFTHRKYVTAYAFPFPLVIFLAQVVKFTGVVVSAFYFWTMRCSHIIAVSLHLLLIVYCRAHLIVCFHSSLHASVDEGHPRA